ncbi:chromosome transmission fidelity protein 8 homolog isoform X2 [Hemitrygon akajei]|uniref:chromosome transmission fidelity protein 8 homolog isoform X2 n=1 Tax=Hemitrygon akajei TaxID=2704970 RepID=UPI003BF9ADD2
MVQIPVALQSARCSSSPEWVLMELQGEIEARHETGLAGSLMGDLHYSQEQVDLSKIHSPQTSNVWIGCWSKLYREEVITLTQWCQGNNLSLNITKTKEMVVDYRRNGERLAPIDINGSGVDRLCMALNCCC